MDRNLRFSLPGRGLVLPCCSWVACQDREELNDELVATNAVVTETQKGAEQVVSDAGTQARD